MSPQGQMTSPGPPSPDLTWLTEVYRHDGLVPTGLEGIAGLDAEGMLSAGANAQSFRLSYEPRSIATCPRGGRIVLGGKDGSLRVLTWQGSQSEWKDEALSPVRQERDGKVGSRAVRALAILRNGAILAGYGANCIGYFESDGSTWSERRFKSSPPTDRASAWKFRFMRLVDFLPGLALGTTVSDQLHLLRYEGGDPEVTHCTSSGLVRRRFISGMEDTPVSRGEERMVDIVRLEREVWILTDEGSLYCAEEVQGAGSFQLQKGFPRALGRIDYREARKLTVSKQGAAIMFRDGVYVIPRTPDGDLELDNRQFYALSDPMDLATIHRPGRNGPVGEIVVATGEGGLTSLPLTEASAGPRSLVGSTSLVLRVASFFDEQSGRSFLTYGTEDHRFVVRSVVDADAVSRLLRGQWERVRQAAEAVEGQAGSALWVLDRWITAELTRALSGMEDDGGALADSFSAKTEEKARALLAKLNADDLVRLVERLTEAWRIRPVRAESRDTLRAVRATTGWALLVFERVEQIDRSLTALLARKLCRGLDGPAVRRVGDYSLGAFLTLIRKWLIHGSTYRRKGKNLETLARINSEGDRNLDALFYLTRLLRRRVDLTWCTFPPAESTDVWDIVGAPNRFTIQSLTGAGITATAHTGEPLRWSFPSQVEDEQYIRASPDRTSIQLFHADVFAEKYRHPPYARRLALIPDGDSFILVFAFKGWRSTSPLPENQQPRIFAIRFEDRSREGELRVTDLTSKPVGTEIYALHYLGKRNDIHHLVAGTSGFRLEATGVIPLTFLDLTLESSDHMELAATFVPGPQTDEDTGRGHPKTHASFDNPSWSASSKVMGGDAWVWVGMQDGHVRCFRRDLTESDSAWTSVSEIVTKGHSLRFDAIRQESPVWHVEYLPEDELLCIGTAGGAVTVFDLSSWVQDEERDRLPASPLIQMDFDTPVCGLVRLEVPTEEGETPPRLVAFSQRGRVAMFDISKRVDPRQRTRSRATFPGHCVDQFSLDRPVRAAWSPSRPWQPSPTVVVGGPQGELRNYSLAFPRRSKQRVSAVEKWTIALQREDRFGFHDEIGEPTTPPLGAVVHSLAPASTGWNARTHDILLYRWLRVLDVGTDHLYRFSLWRELSTEAEALLSVLEQLGIGEEDIGAKRNEISGLFQGFVSRINELAEAVLTRRPLERHPLEIIADKGARVANALSEAIAEGRAPGLSGDLAKWATTMACSVDDLASRWIGSSLAEEGHVLTYTFRRLFHWSSVLLLSWSDPPCDLSDFLDNLLNRLVLRRLRYTQDHRVPLNTLREINASMYRAVLRRRDSGIRLALRPGAAQGRDGEKLPVGFVDLLIQVGDLADSRYGFLRATSPLSSEICKFFAFSLLLHPDSSLIIGQVFSESRLLEIDETLGRMVLSYVEVSADRMGLKGEEFTLARQRFNAYIAPRPEFDVVLDGGPIDSTWGLLMDLAQSEGDGDPAPLTDRDFAREQGHVLTISACLSLLKPVDHSQPGVARALEWLEGGCRYFCHSHRMLKHLRRRHDEILRTLASPDRINRTAVASAIRRAQELCGTVEHELEREQHLFEPQRSHYREIVSRWRRQVDRVSRDAADVLNLLDRFNRHVYRSCADRLIASVTELAFQVSPVDYMEKSDYGRPRRILLRSALMNHPLVSRVFETAVAMADNSQLLGTLLTVARRRFDPIASSDAPPATTITGRELSLAFEEAFRLSGLPELEWTGRIAPSLSVPGLTVVWQAIAREIALNEERYGGTTVAPLYALKGMYRPEANDHVLEFRGRVPFYSTLARSFRSELEDLPEEQRSVKLMALAAGAWEAAVRYAPRRGDSTGFGLYMIHEICELLRIEMSTDIRPAGDGGHDRCQWPFVVAFRWPGR